MRVILTLVAVALVTLLTAALLVPRFIDWSAHRAEIAARLETLTGGRVSLDGPVTLRLLPTPYLKVGSGSVAGVGEGAPRLAFEGARFELALAGIASGALRFADIRLDKPVLTLTRLADGALVLPAASATDAMGFDRFSVRDATIRIVSQGRAVGTIGGVEIQGDAPSLAGPWRVVGTLAGPGGAPVAFRLASEKAGNAGAPVRLTVEGGPRWPALEFDGTLALDQKGARVGGAAVLTGTSPEADGGVPWRAAGQLAADLDGASLTGAEFRFGPEELAIRAEGSAALAAGAPARLTVDATAKQANLDALLRRKGEDGVPPAVALERLAAALAPALGAVAPGRLEARLAVETAILGGDALTGTTAALAAAPGEPAKVRFALGLPGGSRLSAEGTADLGAKPTFAGAVDLTAEDPGLLAAWAAQGAPELAAWASGLDGGIAGSNLAASGTVEATSAGLSAKNLRIGFGRSILNGAVSIARPAGAAPGRIAAQLAADPLDIDALPSLAAARSLIGGYDVALTFDAKSVRVARLGEAGIAGASVGLTLSRTGANVALDRLSLAGLGGAALDAGGAFGPDGLAARGRLAAEKLVDFAALASRLAPGPWMRALVERAPLLSPALIDFEATGGPSEGDAPVLRSLKAIGTAAETRVSLDLQPAAKGETVVLGLDSPNAAALLRQIGVGAARGQAGPGHLDAHASGAWAPGYEVDASASLAGAALGWRGRLAPAAEGDAASLFGAAKLDGANLAPLAALLGLAPAGAAIGPVSATADVTRRGDRWTVSRIVASGDGLRATGSLVYQRPPDSGPLLADPDLQRAVEAASGPDSSPPPATITGELSFDRLRLSDVAALALGPAQPARTGALWSASGFSAPPLALPAAAVNVRAGSFGLSDGLLAQGFSTNLRLDRGRLDLDNLAVTVAGGAVSGHATLRRSGDSATLEGALTAEPLAVARPGLRGRIGGRLDFASTGKSPAALIAGLAGDGEARFAGAALAHSDPAALDRVVAGAQAEGASIDETNVAHAFSLALDRGALEIPDGAAPMAMSAGKIKLGPLGFKAKRVDAALTATFDLATLSLETRLALSEPATGLKFWSGPPPSATVAVDNALDAPKRRLDVAALAAGLATQAIERESDRIANFEADIRERAFFNRRLKGERFLDRRNAEIQDWRAEQERLNGLAQRLAAERAEEERLRVEEARRQAEERLAAERAARKAAEERAAAPPLSPDEPAPPGDAGAGASGLDAPSPPPKPASSAPDPAASGVY